MTSSFADDVARRARVLACSYTLGTFVIITLTLMFTGAHPPPLESEDELCHRVVQAGGFTVMNKCQLQQAHSRPYCPFSIHFRIVHSHQPLRTR